MKNLLNITILSSILSFSCKVHSQDLVTSATDFAASVGESLSNLNLTDTPIQQMDKPIATESVCNLDNCTVSEEMSVEMEAKNRLTSEMEGAALRIRREQMRTCSGAQGEHNKYCSEDVISALENQVKGVEQQVADKIEAAGMAMNSGDADTSFFNQVIEELEELKNLLSAKEQTLRSQNEACRTLISQVNRMCVQPELTTSDLALNAGDTLQVPTPVVTGAATMTQPVTIPSRNIEVAREESYSVQSSFASGTNVISGNITRSKTQADNIIARLRPLVGAGAAYSGGTTGACPDPVAGGPGCSSTTETTPRAALSFGNLSGDPAQATYPVAAGGGGGTAPVAPGGGGATAADLAADASSRAYGGETGGGATDSTSSGVPSGSTANSGSPGGGPTGSGGGFGSALSGLGSMFGKTSGSFGDSNSYGSNYGSNRYGSSNNSGGNSGGRANPSYFDGSANPSQGGIPQGQAQGRGFPQQAGGTPSFGGANAAGRNGQPQAGGSSLSGFDSSSGSGNNADSKPSLFSRLLGKKDKSMFGKTSNSGGGGGSMFGTSSKTNSRIRGLNPNSADPSNAVTPEGRRFDPSKYMPSKAAEERAYLRSTGRKMASRSLASAESGFQWPNDISRNKNLNLFKTVNIIHRAKLAQ